MPLFSINIFELTFKTKNGFYKEAKNFYLAFTKTGIAEALKGEKETKKSTNQKTILRMTNKNPQKST